MNADLCRSLAVLSEPPDRGTAAVAEALGLPRAPTREEFTDLFVMQLTPYASVYLGPEGQLGGEARDRVAGFWRALGMTPSSEADHLAALLGLYAALVDSGDTDASAQRKHASGALLWEHMLSWIPLFAQRVMEIAPAPYREWASILGTTLRETAPSPPPSLPLHLREAPDLPNPEAAELDDILTAVLVPVRSGIIVTRHDLIMMARKLGIGLRQGERRFILGALVDQDPVGVFGWLESEAARQQPAGTDPISTFWRERGQHTERLLQTLTQTAARAAGRI